MRCRSMPFVALAMTLWAGCTQPGVPTPGASSLPPVSSTMAQQAAFQKPTALTTDSTGNVYVADLWNDRIDRISPVGQLSVAKELPSGYPFGSPEPLIMGQVIQAMAMDADGALYVASNRHPVVVRIDADGAIAKVWSDDTITVESPQDIALDRNGDLIVLNTQAKRLVRVPHAGGAAVELLTPGAQVRHNGTVLPDWKSFIALAVDPAGRIVLSEGQQDYASPKDLQPNRILRLESDGHLELIAGDVAPGFSGDGGPAVDARLNQPGALAIADDGTIDVADMGNRRVRRMTPDGLITTVAGNDMPTVRYPDNGDGGPATNARLVNIADVALDPQGNLFISDSFMKQIRRVDRAGIITRFAGKASEGSMASPYAAELSALSTADRDAASVIIQAMRAFNDRRAESDGWYAKSLASQDLLTLQESYMGGGLQQTRSSGTSADGAVIRSLTTEKPDKPQTVIETLTRTDASDQTLHQLMLDRLTWYHGGFLAWGQLREKETIDPGRFGLSSTMTLTTRNTWGESVYDLTANRHPGPTDAPAASGEIVQYLGGTQTRRYTFQWDSQASPPLTVQEKDGNLKAEGSFGTDGQKLQRMTFRSGAGPTGTVNLP